MSCLVYGCNRPADAEGLCRVHGDHPGATWHVVANDVGQVLAVYGAALLSEAQEFARRTNAQVGFCCTRLHTLTLLDRPRVGDSVAEELP